MVGIIQFVVATDGKLAGFCRQQLGAVVTVVATQPSGFAL